MSRTYRNGRPPFLALKHQDTFRCRHCRMLVGPARWGGKHRNHCPHCLYSRHVDDRAPGDRAGTCGASMMPIGVYARGNGELALVHRCLGCHVDRHNRVAADDDLGFVTGLPRIEPRD